MNCPIVFPKLLAAAVHVYRPCCLATVSLFGSRTPAQHADIAVYVNPDQRISTHDSSIPSQPERRVFVRAFDFFGPPLGIFAGDDPGILMTGSSPAGFTSLPGNTTLNLSIVPLHVPGLGIGNLLYWDGVGMDVDFAAPPAGHVLITEDATGVTEVTMNGSLERFDSLVAGVTDANGGIHEHLTHALENNGSPPAGGIYVMGWQFAMTGLEPSRYAIAGLVSPGIPGAQRTQAIQWLTDNLSIIRIAGDFDDSGDYTTSDVNELVAAIAAGSNNVAYDLTLDGSVDATDLEVWRGIAGDVLYASGAPILLGDANLDGAVDGQDFIAWNSSKFTMTARWSDGDFNADGVIDGQDFIVWNIHKFQSADGSTAVPESGLLQLWSLIWLRSVATTGRQDWVTEADER